MRDLTKLKLVGFLQYASFFLPVTALYFTDAGLGLDQLVYTQVFFSIAVLVFEVPTGILADKFGQKVSLSMGMFFAGFAQIVMIFAPSLFGLYLAYLFRGLGRAFVSGSDTALIYEVSGKDNYRKNLASYKSLGKLGMILTTFFTAILLAYLGTKAYVPAFALTAITMGIGSLVALTVKHNPNVEEQRLTSGRQDLFYFFREGLKLIKGRRELFVLTLTIGLLFNGQHIVKGIYQPYFQDSGVPDFWIGAVLTAGAIVNFITIRYAYILKDHFNLRQVLAIVFIPIAVIYIILGSISLPIVLVSGYALLHGLFDLHKIEISDFINKRTPSNIRSTVLSTISLSEQLVVTALKFGFGVVVGLVGISGSFQAFGIYLILAVITLQIVYKRYDLR